MVIDLSRFLVRVQKDKVLPYEIEKFLRTLVTDPELRQQCSLIGKTVRLEIEERQDHCLSMVRFFVLQPIDPSHRPENYGGRIHKHPQAWYETSTVFSNGVAANYMDPSWYPHRRSYHISPHLGIPVAALEDLWNTQGYLITKRPTP